MTASAGNPWADVTRTSLLLSIGAKAARKQIPPIIRMFVSLYHRTYLNRYRMLVHEIGNEPNRWMPVIAAARLNEDIVPERGALIKMVEDG